ncbi:MAG: 4-hydroxy-3-methylbut-2-enyl diphosphate reductase [Candidatus Latescibacteria bacterium]|nr:4-hydroxy-3-methylbut-2-enyl diphosphate reductase [Candidatus Latescibacterota bacterium]
MKINLAKSAGFCFGVERAIEIALDSTEHYDNVWMLGDIVHNEHVVNQIGEAGIHVTKKLPDIPDGTLLLRAHGTVPEIYQKAREQGLNIVDATCPLVLDIHDTAKELEAEGYQLVIIGDHGHDEVVGIAGQVSHEAIVVASPDEAQNLKRLKKAGVVVQSTQDIDNVRAIIAELILKCREMKFINTICGPTTRHQNEIRKMPHVNDVMIIVGSRTSANTLRLTQISTALNPHTYQVQSADDVDPSWFNDAETVGVSAGASTPDWVIDEVVKRIEEIDQQKQEEL